VEPEEARSILRPQKDDRYGFGFALSPYRGCEHGCRYCYVREYPQSLPGDKGAPVGQEAWGTWAVPKLNAPELLWSQRHRLHGQSVFLASATDPYQPLEREFRLTRACLEVLLQCPTTRVLVQTRSPLVLQDVELLKAFGNRLRVGFSIPTDDDTVRQVVEPRAPAIPSRWAAMERLAKAGIEVNLAVCPLMPVHNPEAFARRAKDSGASGAWVGGLRLLKDDPFYEVLARNDWLFILDSEYAEQVAGVLQGTFPRTRHDRGVPAGPKSPVHIPAGPVQRSLFESM
jgi:DNA repair photolyase